jgi:hypothetical protein
MRKKYLKKGATTKEWTIGELALLKRNSSPERAQNLLDSLPYRCEDGHFSARSALQEGRAHCFDGSLLAAAALSRGDCVPMLVDLCAIRDDDHILCVYKWRNFWGAVAKSNFPGLRFREPIFKTVRELALSYFELYFNMQREKSLRSFSKPLRLPSRTKLDWDCDDATGDRLVDLLNAQPHYPIIAPHHASRLRAVDQRFFQSQLVGVNRRGVYRE